MKKAVVFLLVIASSLFVYGADQSIGFIVSESILQQLTEAQDAQKQLDAIAGEWQTELTKMQADIQKKFEDYDKRKLIMTDKRRAEAEKEIQDLDKAMVEYRTKKFGTNGELYAKQSELMKPVQDKLFKAVKDVADEEGYDYIFDKSSSTMLMYVNEKHNLTAKVLEKLGQK